MAWYMVLPGGHGRIYSMAWHGIWHCLARYRMVYGVAWWDDMYMVWPGPHGMVYGMV